MTLAGKERGMKKKIRKETFILRIPGKVINLKEKTINMPSPQVARLLRALEKALDDVGAEYETIIEIHEEKP